MGVSKVVLNGNVLVDLTGVTVEASNLVSPNTAVGADGEDVTGSLQAKTSADLEVSGATVTAPAGVYSSDASKSVASGSATTPATTISSSPTITVSSAGLITATNSKTQSVTPTVSAGYVSSGTAGTITVSGSNTKQLTTQGAQTKYPSTSDQTISSGRYLTGTQTFKGVLLTNLTAGNIKKDVVVKVGDSADDDRITAVTGTYEGSSATLGTKSITANGTYNAADDSLDGYSSVTVSVSGGGGPNLPDPSTVTDLANTTWLLNETIDTTTFPFTFSAPAQVTVETAAPSSKTPGRQTWGGEDAIFAPNFIFDRPHRYSGASKSIQCGSSAYMVDYNVWYGSWYGTGGIIYYNDYVSPPKTTFKFGESGDPQPGLRVWTFWGDYPNGMSMSQTDNTNANLIAWMKNNATLINVG